MPKRFGITITLENLSPAAFETYLATQKAMYLVLARNAQVGTSGNEGTPKATKIEEEKAPTPFFSHSLDVLLNSYTGRSDQKYLYE